MSNFRNKSVDVHQFSMIPKAEIPRSAFDRQWVHKTAFDSGYLIPIYCDEVLPGDTFNMNVTMFGRLSTPIFPTLDNLHLDSFFFFVPNRLVWSNWQKFMGQQTNPGDSISYSVPQIVSKAGGYDVSSIFDYYGLPTAGQMSGSNTISHNALFLRAYNLIYNEWFRDENLQNSLTVNTGDGPDLYTDYALVRRGKRKDYFTSALPWPQKGTAVNLPLGSSAPIKFNGVSGNYVNVVDSTNVSRTLGTSVSGGGVYAMGTPATPNATLYADLSQATSATVNQLRQSFQIQKLLERDARGGTRYTEIIYAHFGVKSPDARLQRPEYLGGGSTPISINPIAQTSASNITGGSTALGNLAAMGTVLARGHNFKGSFTEHGMIIGLVNVRADLSYQQGMHKMWSRSTRYDYYFPVFAALGEQAVLNKEIYATGTSTDNDVFGYQERWAEYRYYPSQITGLMRSTASGTLDPWHYSQKFASLPTLNSTFIQETPPLDRTLAVGSAANGKQIIFDAFFSNRVVRPMPMYSVPGLIDHF
jgi:hypothetical protein